MPKVPWLHMISHTDPAQFIAEVNEMRLEHPKADLQFSTCFKPANMGGLEQPTPEQVVWCCVATWWE